MGRRTFFIIAGLVAGQFCRVAGLEGLCLRPSRALFTPGVSSPMMAIWSVIPRGGYTEVLAWGLATLAVYRRVTRPDRPPMGGLAQLVWGALFTLGYFLNPLSLVIYVALAIDWTFGRHGLDIRREPRRCKGWRLGAFDRPWAGIAWLDALAAWSATTWPWSQDRLPRHPGDEWQPRYVFLMDLLPGRIGTAGGVTVVLATFALVAWWTGLARRVVSLLATRPAFALGAMIGLGPFLIYAAGAGEARPLAARACSSCRSGSGRPGRSARTWPTASPRSAPSSAGRSGAGTCPTSACPCSACPRSPGRCSRPGLPMATLYGPSSRRLLVALVVVTVARA